MSEQAPVFIRMTIRSLDDDNEVFFSNEDENLEVIEVIPGEGHIFPKIEALLNDMNIGERKTVSLTKEDAFGDPMDEAVQKVPSEHIPEELRKPGEMIGAQTENGETVQGIVVALEGEEVVIDFNHPLAGKNIEVDFIIVEEPSE